MALPPVNINQVGSLATLTNLGQGLSSFQPGLTTVNLSGVQLPEIPNLAALQSLGAQIPGITVNGLNVSTALSSTLGTAAGLAQSTKAMPSIIIKSVVEGDFKFPGAITPTEIQHAEKMIHDVWKELGGKSPLNGITIGDQLFRGGLDPLKLIKQFDPKNTSGIFPDVLNIMDQLKSTAKNALDQAIAPLQSVLGGDLLGKLNSISSILSSIQKTEDKDEKLDPVILLIITTAMSRLVVEDPEQAIVAGKNLNDTEIDNISRAYYKNEQYSSEVMPEKFVLFVNEAIAIVRLTKVAK